MAIRRFPRHFLQHSRRSTAAARNTALAVLGAALFLAACSCLRGGGRGVDGGGGASGVLPRNASSSSAFVTAPGGGGASRNPHGSFPPASGKDENTPSGLMPLSAEATAVLLSVAAVASVGAGVKGARRLTGETTVDGGIRGCRTSPGVVARGAQVDWLGTNTGWQDLDQSSFSDIDFMNVHGLLTICSLLLILFQGVRIGLHQAPSISEVWATTAIYLPWSYFCFKDTKHLESHYQVTFYASCGWAIMSLASLHSVVYQDKYPELAFGVLAVGFLVFAISCVYFYGYHWTRMWRHYQQNRFRPLWIPGLVGLMALHALTFLDFAKRVDDMKWWSVVCQIYPDEWWWVADVRCIELFVTAAALGLIILHIKGVFTGMKNAAVVVFGTIFLPLVVMVLESCWLRASSWQHYFMVGPKYW